MDIYLYISTIGPKRQESDLFYLMPMVMYGIFHLAFAYGLTVACCCCVELYIFLCYGVALLLFSLYFGDLKSTSFVVSTLICEKELVVRFSPSQAHKFAKIFCINLFGSNTIILYILPVC